MDKIRYGVVHQGSVLSPLLFFWFVNDIGIRLGTTDINWYADDTNVFFFCPAGQFEKNMDSLEEKENEWLKHLSVWLMTNKLELNTEKTKCCFSEKIKLYRRPLKNISRRFDWTGHLRNVSWYYFSWNTRLDISKKVCTSLSLSVGVIKKIWWFLGIWVTKQLYCF